MTVVKIRFACPSCERPSLVENEQVSTPEASAWECPACDHRLAFQWGSPADSVCHCPICGNPELYKKKDFPHWLGLSVLAGSCLTFFIASLVYHQWWGWGILIGSAAFDGILYLCVKDVLVCYRCSAQFRGYSPNPAHRPFELGIAERYRQERLRREQLHHGESAGGRTAT